MRFAIPAILALAGCGGGGSALEGIYTVDAWNDNPSSCTDPGPSTLVDHDPLVFVKKESFFGQSFLAVNECTDNGACTTEANDEDVDLGSFILDSGNDDDGWTGEIIYASGPDTSNMCSGGVIRATLTTDGEMAFQVRNETIDSAPFSPNGTDCDTDDAKTAAEGQPCIGVETMHATFTADL